MMTERKPHSEPGGRLLTAPMRKEASLWEHADELRPYLEVVAARMLGKRLAAKVDPADVVQAALLASYLRFSQFRGSTVEAWQAWLVAIVRNEARQLQRFWHRQQRDVDDEFSLYQGSRCQYERDCRRGTPGDQVLRREAVARLRAALERLRPQDRELVRLRCFEGLRHAEIAARLNRSEEAVRQLWAAVLVRLRRELKEE